LSFTDSYIYFLYAAFGIALVQFLKDFVSDFLYSKEDFDNGEKNCINTLKKFFRILNQEEHPGPLSGIITDFQTLRLILYIEVSNEELAYHVLIPSYINTLVYVFLNYLKSEKFSSKLTPIFFIGLVIHILSFNNAILPYICIIMKTKNIYPFGWPFIYIWFFIDKVTPIFDFIDFFCGFTQQIRDKTRTFKETRTLLLTFFYTTSQILMLLKLQIIISTSFWIAAPIIGMVISLLFPYENFSQKRKIIIK
jgi:hypothetical protein